MHAGAEIATADAAGNCPDESNTSMTGVPKPGISRSRGDIMSPEARRRVMSRIRGKDTRPERAISEELRSRGLKWEGHVRDLPGRPDFVFREARVAVFVDGDFWHGWRFPTWRKKLSPKWEEKIEATRLRDARNHRKLRRMGWVVVRVWEHQVYRDPAGCVARIVGHLNKQVRMSADGCSSDESKDEA